MQRNALRRAFKPPSFVDKPLPEQSKGFTPQPAAQKEQPQAPDACQAMQSVKRRRLLICPTSTPCPKPSPSTTRMQEETGREHSSAPKPVKHEAPKPASIMPKLLPDVHLEAAEIPPKAEPHLPGLNATLEPCVLPSEGMPLLDHNIVQIIQAVLIPQPLQYTAGYSKDQRLGCLSVASVVSARSRCSLPGQWLAHGAVAKLSMPTLRAAGGASPADPVSPPSEQPQHNAALVGAAGDAVEKLTPHGSKSQFPLSQPPWALQQLLREVCPAGGNSRGTALHTRALAETATGPVSQKQALQHTGATAPRQMQLGMPAAKPVSMSSPGCEQPPARPGDTDLHAAMLTQLELQDIEMREVVKSPEKQMAEVMRHPFPLIGLKLDMAFLKSVCNG